MKYFFFFTIAFIVPVVAIEAQTNPAPEALLAMSKKLASLKSISYQYYREVNNSANNYFNKLTGTCYIDFDQIDKRSVSRFRMESDDYISIYNGAELFALNKATKTCSVIEQPQPRLLGSQSFFFNSIQTLRSELQQLVEIDTIAKHQLSDTTIQDKPYKLIQLDLHRSSLQYQGSSMRFTKDVTISYLIVIDPTTWLPYQVLESNNIDKEGYNTKTVFTHINTDPKEPDTYSWYYATYQKDFQPEKKEKDTPLITKGSIITSDWLLPEFNGKDPYFKSSSLKGKLVLLDFWIKNCGPCMESFPVLQQLQKKYGGNKFQLITINAYDKKDEIGFFYTREKPEYKMLYNGAAMAKELGVSYYPTVILADKTGKVIYAGKFEHIAVENLIKANL